MARSRFSVLIAAACLAVANFGTAIREATERISGAIWSVAAFFVRSIAYPQTWLTPAFAGGQSLFGPMGSYETQPDSVLRHEANVSRRSADRHT